MSNMYVIEVLKGKGEEWGWNNIWKYSGKKFSKTNERPQYDWLNCFIFAPKKTQKFLLHQSTC